MTLRELFHRRLHGLFGGIRLEHWLRRHPLVFLVQRDEEALLRAATPEVIGADVARNSIQPGLEAARGSQPRETSHHLDEDDLAEVQVLITLADLRDHKAPDRQLILANQILQSSQIA